ncbi:hypothetical protein [Salinactinospora qingdaonensis]|uniref:Uncharacterized protein n=1 Tax=Salinactinospora qingdaonensis TaxID=702744 RepID=A0ABP7GCW7_9ACTN
MSCGDQRSLTREVSAFVELLRERFERPLLAPVDPGEDAALFEIKAEVMEALAVQRGDGESRAVADNARAVANAKRARIGGER